MKKQNKILLAVLTVVVIAGVALFTGNSKLFQGKLSPFAQGTDAFTLVDSGLLDNDFDGVAFPEDQCPNTPAHQIVRFGPKDYTTYLGQKIQLVEVYNDLSSGFKVGKKSYGVPQNGSTYVEPVLSSKHPGFKIKSLFSMHSPSGTDDEAIVVISRTDYNIDTGCSN